MPETTLRLLLALIGLAAFLALIWATTRHMSSTASAWTRGGAVALAVSGLFALLAFLGRVQ